MELETKGKVYHFLINFLRLIQTSIAPFLFNLDYLKDIILYLLLKDTVNQIEENCNQINIEYDCLAASGTEKEILTALLITFCVSIILTSIHSFFLRKMFFKTNIWLNLVFAVFSPVLPAIYHFRLSQMRLKLHNQRSKLSKDVLIKETSRIENLTNSLQLNSEIEKGFEATMQIILLFGLLCFYLFVFKTPSGQTYSYFFGIAHIELRGNLILFLALSSSYPLNGQNPLGSF